MRVGTLAKSCAVNCARIVVCVAQCNSATLVKNREKSSHESRGEALNFRLAAADHLESGARVWLVALSCVTELRAARRGVAAERTRRGSLAVASAASARKRRQRAVAQINKRTATGRQTCKQTNKLTNKCARASKLASSCSALCGSQMTVGEFLSTQAN